MDGTGTIAQAGPYPYTSPMAATPTTETLIGYARCSTDRQQRELRRMHATGEYSISDLAELFSVSRPTVYRTLTR